MKKSIKWLIALFTLIAPMSSFSQTINEIRLTPKRFYLQDTVYLGFNPLQINYLRKVLELKPLYEEKIGEQNHLISNLYLQIANKDSLLSNEVKYNDGLQKMLDNQRAQIAQHEQITAKLRRANRRNFYAKSLYKIATGILAGACVYLILK